MIRGFFGLVVGLGLGAAALVPPAPVIADEIPAELLQDLQLGQVARPQVVITGSETMDPFTARIFQELGERSQVPPPDSHPIGTRTGFIKFCEGIGPDYPDIIAATRRMRQSEFDLCLSRGIADLIELPIGYSALVFVARKDDRPLKLTPRNLYQAIAAEVPEGQDMEPNRYSTWHQIDKALPTTEIRVILPVTAAGTRNFFDDMFMQGGCRKFSPIKNIFDDRERVKLCITPRSDGRVAEVPANYDDLLPGKLLASPPGTIGILPYFIATAHLDQLQILPVNGVMPSPESIVDDSYEGVHTLYYYVKRAHMRDAQGRGVVRGLRQFIIEATSEEARGPSGYLSAMGVVPLPARLRAEERRSALRLERFSR